MTPAFSGEVHPFAGSFPMLPDGALESLAADISDNGLKDPILLDPDGVLLDGRNRLAACDLADVEPVFEIVTEDPVTVIFSKNLQRRDLGQAQKAHLVVAGLLDSNNRQTDLAGIAGVSQADIAQAQMVARFTAPDVPGQVIAGTLPHQQAYEQAKTVKARLKQEQRQRDELGRNAPDLLDSLPLDEAWAAYWARTKEQREAAEAEADKHRKVLAELASAVSALTPYANPDTIAGLTVDDFDHAHDIDRTTITDLRLLGVALEGLSAYIDWLENAL